MISRTVRFVRLAVLGAVLSLLVPAAPSLAQDLQAELSALAQAGGGVHRLAPGARVTVRDGVVVPRGVTLDLNGGEIVAVLDDPNAAGVRLMSDATLRNGTVSVVSRGNPGTQAGAHAAVLIGALYGDNPAPDRLSPFDSPSGWTVSNVTLRSDKRVAVDGMQLGAAGIQVMGGSHGGLIERVTIPDSDRMAAGVMLDWGTVGAIASGDVPGSAAAYHRGAAYTTHPHDIVIRDIRIGRLTRPSVREYGSFGVRLSGVHDVTVSNVTVGSVSEAAFFHTAGDLGYEFARPADRARAHRGIVVDGLTVQRAGAYVVRTDSYADNVGRAAEQGYRPMLAPIAPTDIVVRNVKGSAMPGAPGFGVRVDHQRGGRFSDIAVTGFRRGFFIDEQVYDFALERPEATDSIEAAISVEHPYRPPARVTVSDPRVGGRGAGASVVIVGRSDAVALTGAGGAAVRLSRQASNARVPAGTPVGD